MALRVVGVAAALIVAAVATLLCRGATGDPAVAVGSPTHRDLVLGFVATGAGIPVAAVLGGRLAPAAARAPAATAFSFVIAEMAVLVILGSAVLVALLFFFGGSGDGVPSPVDTLVLAGYAVLGGVVAGAILGWPALAVTLPSAIAWAVVVRCYARGQERREVA